MSEWKPKRFWTKASAAQVDGGWTVHLDNRGIKTPAKAPLIVPTRALADALAHEWDAQTDTVDPETMPLTRAANSAIDKVIPQRDGVIQMLAGYGETDLLCYRADVPQALAQRQAEAWDPLLDWAAARYDARLIPVAGVMYQAPDQAALDRLAAVMAPMGNFDLTALHDLVTISGSLVLGLAVMDRHIDAKTAWTLSRVDESWQQDQWGTDDEAEQKATLAHDALVNAERLARLSCQPQ